MNHPMHQSIISVRQEREESREEIAHGFSVEVKPRRARLVRGWVTLTDRRLSHMHGFSGKIPRRVTLTYE